MCTSSVCPGKKYHCETWKNAGFQYDSEVSDLDTPLVTTRCGLMFMLKIVMVTWIILRILLLLRNMSKMLLIIKATRMIGTLINIYDQARVFCPQWVGFP